MDTYRTADEFVVGCDDESAPLEEEQKADGFSTTNMVTAVDSYYISPAQVKRDVAKLIGGLLMIFVVIPFVYICAEEPSRQQEMRQARTTSMAKWSTWERWLTRNCTIAGERDIQSNAETVPMLRYACKDGKEYEIARFQLNAAKVCAGPDLDACVEHGMPEAPVSWPGASR